MTEQPELVWEDPPESKSRKPGSQSHRYDLIAAVLRENPGRWARLGTGTSGIVTHIRRGRAPAFRPAGAFEATTRGRKGTQATVYIRYVGEPTDD